MTDTDPLESPEFKQHIRNLLYEYSIAHITSNYVSFTEDLVAEFLERLKPIPLSDPYSFTLLPDPFVVLFQTYSLSSLEPYDEVAVTTQEACAHIKRWGATPKGIPRTEKLKTQWSDDSYQPPPEEFIPALTRQARKATPKLGKKTKPACHETYQALIESQKIIAVHVEPVEEPTLVPEEILQTALDIDPDDLPAVKALLQSAANSLRPRKDYKNPYLDPTLLRTQFPKEHDYEPPEEELVPLFPRSRVPASESGSSSKGSGAGVLPGLKGFSDIPSAVSWKRVEVEDPDPDISRQNLVVVDGWETIKSSPPSAPSSVRSDSDHEDQLNELFLISSPPTTDPPLVEEIDNAKMEEVIIPRSRKVGGKSGITPHILAGKTLQTFLGPLLSQTKTTKIRPIPAPATSLSAKEAQNGWLPPSSPTPSSLVGQPPSILNVYGRIDGDTEEEKEVQERDLDSELKELYEGRVDALEDMIMNEKIEDTQENMLWDVPDLPPPTVRPSNTDTNWLHVPRTFIDFLVPPSIGSNANVQSSRLELKPPHQFLKKAKGRQSLGLALSWIPFTVDKKLPSVLELVGVEEPFGHDASTGCDSVTEVDKVFKALKVDTDPVDASGPPNPQEQADARLFSSSWLEKEESRLPEAYSFLSEGFQIMLNRQERRRLAKAEGRLVEYEDEGVDEDEEVEVEVEPGKGVVNVEDVDVDDGVVPRPGRAPVVHVAVGGDENGRRRGGAFEHEHLQQDDRRPSKRPRLGQDQNLHYAATAVATASGGGGDLALRRAGDPELQQQASSHGQDPAPFSEDDSDYGYVSPPAAAFTSLHGRPPGDDYSRHDAHQGDVGDDDDKENLPPPTSSYSSSMYLDDGYGVDGADYDYDYGHEYQDGGQVGLPGHISGGDSYGHLYNRDEVQQPYNHYPIAADHMDIANTFDDDEGEFATDMHDYPHEDGGGSFEPLSFASQYAFAAGQAQTSVSMPPAVEQDVDYGHSQGYEQVIAANDHRGTEDIVMASAVVNEEENSSAGVPQDPLPLAYEPQLASQSLGIFAFAHLRAKKVSAPAATATSMYEPAPVLPTPALLNEDRERGLPPELLDKDTLCLSTTSFSPPCSIHRYMASLDLIQKHGFVRALRSEDCAIELVERRSLGGVDLTLDPYCAVIFLSLFMLPARCEAYVDRVSKQSWMYRKLLVVFEAYPEQLSKRGKAAKAGISTGGSSSDLYAYTPPIVKAIKKFRRDINIAEAYGSKRAATTVQYAFVDNVHEAALFTRWFGDRAEENDGTGGMIWGERRWLGEDYFEEEEDCLAGVNGLNHFSASIILSQIPLHEFLHLLPEERAEVCGGLLADEIIAEFNADMENRLRAIGNSSDDLS